MSPSEIKAALSERATVAITLRQEAASRFDAAAKRWRRAPVEARIAVACVIANRVKAPGRFGTSFKDVCLKPSAFSCWLQIRETNGDETLAIARAIVTGAPTFDRDAMLRECLWIADGVIAGAITDQVANATHYHADWMAQFPKWAQHQTPVAHVGNHLFYAGIR